MMWRLIIDGDLIGYFATFFDALQHVRLFGSQKRVDMQLVQVGEVTEDILEDIE